MNTSVDFNSLPLPELFAALVQSGNVLRLLELARDEDLGPAGSPAGDITGVAWGAGADRANARLATRAMGTAAGLALAPMLIELFAPKCRWEAAVADGQPVSRGATLGLLRGPRDEALALERTLLNLIGRLCGIATLTARFVEMMKRQSPGAAARLFDTRKTTPGMRALEKYAVRCGGGFLHRMGLYDAVLIKDNHIAGLSLDELANRVAQASAKARSMAPIRFVEVEVDSLAQLERLLELPSGVVDIVLLDNMAPPALADAVRMRDGAGASLQLEASGGVTLETIGAIARSGVERISVGALTHSAIALDVGLDID